VTAGCGAEEGARRTRAATSRAHGFRRFHPGAAGLPRCSSQGDVAEPARVRARLVAGAALLVVIASRGVRLVCLLRCPAWVKVCCTGFS